MGINLNNLKQQSIQSTNLNFVPVYSDLHLDLGISYTMHNQLYRKNERKDLILDYNAESIQNSLYNIFDTLPGQKILNPSFGLDLRQFLFEPVNEFIANNIGETILVNLKIYEPRITVTNINVYPNNESQQYEITISYTIPKFKDDTNQEFYIFKHNLNGNLGVNI